MINSKIFSLLNFDKYIYLIIITNILSILLLSDTTSLNFGLISLQSLFYCLNSYLFVLFIIFETTSAYLDFYGLTLNFVQLTLTNPKNHNLYFDLYILLVNLKYFIYLLLNLFFLFFAENLFNLFKPIFIKKKLFFFVSLIVIFFILFTIFKQRYSATFEKISIRILKKITYIKKGNFVRNDNWYIVLKNTINYSDLDNNLFDFSFRESFKDIENTNNIYIVINESYPNFRDKETKEKLLTVLKSNLQNIEITNYKKNWSKNYSTQGAEMELFCDKKGTWKQFKTDFNYFLKKNDCWINTFSKRHNIFIHSWNKKSFDRSRYGSGSPPFFDELYFKENLLKMNYSICNKNIYYAGICESEIINKLLYKIKKINKNKLIVYLTVENHIPLNLLNKKDLLCDYYPLNLHPQFCSLYNNQLKFNGDLNKFINQLSPNDLLVFFSDTPPLFSLRDRIHFEDYIDVFFFRKKN